MNTALVAAIALAVLQLLDIWSTHLFRSVGIREANPIFGPTFDRVPFWVAIIGKLALAAALIGVTAVATDRASQIILTIITSVLVLIYTHIVVGNFAAWHRKKG